MAFRISLTTEAESQFEALSARQQRLLETAIHACLLHKPGTPTKAIKKLRPNPLAEFELRAGDLRVLYNIEGNEVVILIVGVKKGNALIVKGKVFYGHQDDSTKPSEGESEGNTR